MADKYHSDTQEKIESIIYDPNVQDSGDLETGTKTITATSKPGTADYSKSLTLAMPTDSRLSIKRICLRGAVTIDSMSAGTLNLEIKAGANVIKTISWTSAGAKLFADDHFTGAYFSDMLAGGAKTYEFRFWVDSGNAVLSVVELWVAVGTSATSGIPEIFRFHYDGLISLAVYATRIGSGAISLTLFRGSRWWHAPVSSSAANIAHVNGTGLCYDCIKGTLEGTVATDLCYLSGIDIVMRSIL